MIVIYDDCELFMMMVNIYHDCEWFIMILSDLS